jgi:hypothetical protein
MEVKMLGTNWVEPGKGATIRYLLSLLRTKWPDSWVAMNHLKNLAAKVGGEGHCTNLALTGGPLCIYDIERIGLCE